MSGTETPRGEPHATAEVAPADAAVEPRGRLAWVWLIPLAAAGVAGWLAWSSYSQRGPLIEITFDTGDGLTAGTTRVRHRSVELGSVETVRLSADLRQVIATVRMRRDAEPYLTDRARFWVVRPRVGIGNLSGLETLVSGAYVSMDPGTERGEPRTRFEGLADAPAVRSDEPGRTFRLRADRIGSIGVGSPVFYRDVTVGEVLEARLPDDGRGPASIMVFVRAPHDRLVQPGSHFWDASGLDFRIGAEGVRLEVQSLRAVLSGGIAFDAPTGPPSQVDTPPPADADFVLYPTRSAADAASFRERIPVIALFETSVRGLGVGAPVEVLGVQVGVVTMIGLLPDYGLGQAPRVRVRMELQPDRVTSAEERRGTTLGDARELTRRMVALGLRAQLRSSSLLTGQMLVALDPVPGAPAAELAYDGDVPILPTASGGGLDDVMATVAAVARKIEALPLDRLVEDLDGTLRSAGAMMGQAQTVLRSTEAGLSPALRELRDALARATRTLASVERGYGADSVIREDAQRTLDQVSDAARSVRLLADFLTRNPEALLRGRAGAAAR